MRRYCRGIGRPLARPRPAGDGDALDHGRTRQDDAGSPQGSNDRRGDGLAAIGAAGNVRRRLDHRRQVGHGRRAQAQGDGELAAWSVMVCGRRAYSAKAAAGMSSWPAIQVTSFGRLAEVGERGAGMPQQGELYCVAEAVGVAAAPGHEAPIGAG